MRRMLVLCTLALLVAVGGANAAEVAQGPLLAIRQPILLDYETLPLLAVTFNHSSHKQVACVLCHHKVTPDGDRYAPCTTDGCHSIPGARERQQDSMFMAYHADKQRSCYGCHTREANTHPEFVGCRPCHYRPLQAQK